MPHAAATLPLHGGRCPPWLFERMKRLGAAIVEVMVHEFGPEEVLRRLSDPYWFQALGCVLGFDWHSSGVTTTVCGALKEGLGPRQRELGLYVAGGKGGASRKTPQEIETHVERDGLAVDGPGLVHASRMAAKVDNTALQDGFQLYHHVFFFSATGAWAVVQQGMEPEGSLARRYHWLSANVRSFVEEPHAAVCCDRTVEPVNLVAGESGACRSTTTALAGEDPAGLARELARIVETGRHLRLPMAHQVPRAAYLEKALLDLYRHPPETFEGLLGSAGVGPKTLRALALIAEVTYGAAPSYRDPVRYSFAHGGKDGTPRPVDRDLYDADIEALNRLLREAKVDRTEKLHAFRRLARYSAELAPR
ncbi:DUF763 domain-containing protein [Limnochorda pilosa]|uniref:DUF763 domain-containing protein n=1 Tax=Limnochorda pilosa TaxID=1555112 RepID=A0A0K2SHV6_LIMPI|nr:DUF763 domain-containing protein [Limnochorda pilosa]BAS26622.1 hypothetical protein LIP_0765 [Limnochorda pilosa]